MSNETIKQWIARSPLRKWLNENVLNNTEFATEVGVSSNTLYNWLQGRQPSDENIRKLASAVGVSESEFRAEWDQWISEWPAP